VAQVPEIRDLVTLTNRADENTGNSIREKGLVLPDGYKLCDDQPSGSFVCPVRSCWTMCKSFKGLASHFKVCNKHSLISILLGISVDLVAAQLAHRGDMFNDNGDGTLSAVQRRSGQEHPIVVSQNSLDPTESPMVLFGVSGHPPGPFDHRVGEQQTGKMATTPDAAPTVARDAMAIDTSPIFVLIFMTGMEWNPWCDECLLHSTLVFASRTRCIMTRTCAKRCGVWSDRAPTASSEMQDPPAASRVHSAALGLHPPAKCRRQRPPAVCLATTSTTRPTITGKRRPCPVIYGSAGGPPRGSQPRRGHLGSEKW